MAFSSVDLRGYSCCHVLPTRVALYPFLCQSTGVTFASLAQSGVCTHMLSTPSPDCSSHRGVRFGSEPTRSRHSAC